MLDGSTTRLSLQVPLEELVSLSARAREAGRPLLVEISGLVSRHLSPIGIDLRLAPSCKGARLGLTFTLAEAVKLQKLAAQENLSAPDWLLECVLA